jgi:hypothetical protein
MNLIQIQEQLKGLPMQAIMSYAGGQNPEVPPYVALAELNRRKQMGSAAQPAQMPQQTVAEEVQQQAGVMAQQEQMMKQAQAMQQQGQQGGVANIPMASDMYSDRAFAGGGVVSYAEGGDTGEEELPPYTLDKAALPYILRLLKGLKAKEPSPEGLEAMRARARARGDMGPDLPPPTDLSSSPKLRPDRGGDIPMPGVSAPMAGPANGPKSPAAKAGVASLLAKVAAAKEQDPEAAGDPGFMKEIMNLLKQSQPGATKTPADWHAQKAAFGLKEPEADPGGRLARLAQMEEERQKLFQGQQKGRTTDNLIAMARAYAQAPRGRTAGAAAGRYGELSSEQQKQDLDQADKRMLVAEKLAAMQDAKQAAIQAYRAGDFAGYVQHSEAAAKAQQEWQKAKMQVAENMYGHQVNRENNIRSNQTSERNTDKHVLATVEAAKVRGARGGGDDKMYDAAIAKVEADPAYKALAKQFEMWGHLDQAKGADLRRQMEAYKAREMAARGYEYPLNKQAGSGNGLPEGAVVRGVFNPATGKVE